MDNVNLSQANQVYISNQAQNKNTTSSIQPQVQQTEDGKNKINKVLIGLGVLGAATIGITCIIRGRKPKNTSDVQKLIKQFQDIDFNKGTAKLKDGTLFTGAIEDTLKSGDKVTMEYVDGILQKSTKTTNGAEVVKEYTNGVISKKNGEVVDIKEVQNEVKTQQDKLKKLLADNKLSSQDFNTQANEIKFKSKKQQAEIKSTFDKKVQSEEAAKAEAERIAQEAQEKAQGQEAERIASNQKPQIEYNIETMSLEELQSYEKKLYNEIMEITKKYSRYAIPANYSAEDYKKYSELTAKKTNVTGKIKKITEEVEFKALAEKLDLTTNARVKNVQSGENIDITLTKSTPKNGGTYRISANNDSKIFGLAEVCTPQKDMLICNLPEGYAQSSLELKYLSSSPEAKGTGTEIIKQIIEDSKKLGYEGRVWTEACGGSLPSQMAILSGNKYATSPVPFYYKLGFRFKDENLNKSVKSGLENLKNGLEYNGPKDGIMFLP